MTAISTNYHELSPAEVDAVAAQCASAWQDPELPQRQYDLVVKPELEKFARGGSVAPFDALVRCMRFLPAKPYTLLDIGAASGYYSRVMEIAGLSVAYTGVDFSPTFVELAKQVFPGIQFKLGDARALPFPDETFDVTLSGACLMHVREYPKAIREAVRVSRRFVIFHRTPVHREPTRFYRKDAYGVTCLEVLFNESELLALFHNQNLNLIAQTAVTWDDATESGYKSFVLEKLMIEPYASNKNV